MDGADAMSRIANVKQSDKKRNMLPQLNGYNKPLLRVSYEFDSRREYQRKKTTFRWSFFACLFSALYIIIEIDTVAIKDNIDNMSCNTSDNVIFYSIGLIIDSMKEISSSVKLYFA